MQTKSWCGFTQTKPGSRVGSRSSNGYGEWGLALSSAAQGSLIDIVGASFFLLYKVVGPMIFFLSLMLLVWGAFRLMVTVLIRIVVIVRCKGCGIWVMTALWGTAGAKSIAGSVFPSKILILKFFKWNFRIFPIQLREFLMWISQKKFFSKM